MKNIHVLPTNKSSRIRIGNDGLYLSRIEFIDATSKQHIYITSDEEIKEGDWYFTILDNEIFKADISTIRIMNDANKYSNTTYKNTHFKIILTTDVDLIKDGVQAIDDDFLEWFVKNPSCEEIKINYEIYKEGVGLLTSDWRMSEDDKYKIIIPKEEPKQETLEEVAIRKRNELGLKGTVEGFIAGAKWQAERMYSEEDMWEAYKASNTVFEDEIALKQEFNEWFEQFKKK